MSQPINASRRALLRHVSALSALGIGMPLALNLATIGAAAAQVAPGTIKDYKAIVCLYLAGGNDAHNTVIATDPTSMASYNMYRGAGTPDTIALSAAEMLPITPITPQTGRTFALHPNLGPLRDLFNQGRLGVVANVGTLMAPMTKLQFLSGAVPAPPALASHNSQSFQWQCRQGIAGWGNRMSELLMSANSVEVLSSISVAGNSPFLAGIRPAQLQVNSDGIPPLNAFVAPNLFGSTMAPATKLQLLSGAVPAPPALASHNSQSFQWQCRQGIAGWGNRMSELLMSANSIEVLSSISVAGNSSFLAGIRPAQLQVNSDGIPPLNAFVAPNLFGSTMAPAANRELMTRNRTEPFAGSQTAVVNRLLEAQSALQHSMLPAGAGGVAGAAVPNGLTVGLQNIARVIGGHATSNVKRQVFYVAIGGFDTHSELLRFHGERMTVVAAAMKYFDDVLGAMNMRDNVTLFTGSDFGRSLTTNHSGADHGWGGHHFVMGGAVRGGDIYGRYPVIGSGTDDDIGRGMLLPGLSIDQYAATIARWFGLSESQLDDVFPLLRNYGTHRNLGFMKT